MRNAKLNIWFQQKKMKDYFGLSSTQFNELFDSLPTLHNFFPGNLKRAKTALLMYLCRLRKGDYCNRIYDFFNVSSRKNTSLIVLISTERY